MVSMPLVKQTFQQIAMDVVGQLPCTQRGNRFILTICDYATHYPEAIAPPSVEAPRVAKELVNLFSHVGVPDEILTDQGTNFMPSLLEEIYCLLHIKRIRTTPYLPQTDGIVERFNGTLKGMLKKFVSRNQRIGINICHIYFLYTVKSHRRQPGFLHLNSFMDVE